MGRYMEIKVNDIFETMADRFRPEGARGMAASFGYEIRENGKWKLTIKDERMILEKKESLNGCEITIKTDGDCLVKLNTGEMDAMEAIKSGRLMVQGKMETFGRLSGLFQKISPKIREEASRELIVLKKTISVNQKFSTGPVMGKFLKALKEKTILAIQCPECGRIQSPPREMCAICRVRNREWVEIGPKGQMRMMEHCYYSSPDPLTGKSRETPYGAIGILLDGCTKEEVFWHLLRPDQIDRVDMGIVMGDRTRPGTRLKPVWAEERQGSIDDIIYFEIDE